jgi:LysR family transcriptional regulator, glycine cleavage system transcriptional activator
MANLPPLHALQAFEAAARLGSFSAAARERHLTQSAISRAVAGVAHWAGEPLFLRHGPRLRLSPAGELLRERLSAPLLALHEALGERPRAARTPQRLTLVVHSVPSLLTSWFMPRLHRLRTAHPELVLSLHVGYELDSLPPLQPAVALRFGSFDRTGLRCTPLWREKLLAVATPDWVQQHGAQPEAWPDQERLRWLSQPWPQRLAGQRLPLADGLASNDALLLLQAALLHQGVAWTRRSLAEPWLHSGQLLALAGQDESLSDKTLWMVHREEFTEQPAVHRFTAWLLTEIGT